METTSNRRGLVFLKRDETRFLERLGKVLFIIIMDGPRPGNPGVERQYTFSAAAPVSDTRLTPPPTPYPSISGGGGSFNPIFSPNFSPLTRSDLESSRVVHQDISL